MDVMLVMFTNDGARRNFPIHTQRVVLGRTSTADLRIPLSSVSRQHCEVRLEGDKIKLRDLGSSNGTYVNSTRVQEATLSAGDEIVVGPVVFTLVVDGNPAHIEPVRSVVGKTKSSGSVGSSPKQAAASASSDEVTEKPQPLATREDDELPAFVEAEQHSPTVDLDDPIAALEAMSQAQAADDDMPLMLDEDEPKQA